MKVIHRDTGMAQSMTVEELVRRGVVGNLLADGTIERLQEEMRNLSAIVARLVECRPESEWLLLTGNTYDLWEAP